MFTLRVGDPELPLMPREKDLQSLIGRRCTGPMYNKAYLV